MLSCKILTKPGGSLERGAAVIFGRRFLAPRFSFAWGTVQAGAAGPPALCGPVSNMDTIPPECVDCIRDCNWCTYNIADPGNYHRR